MPTTFTLKTGAPSPVDVWLPSGATWKFATTTATGQGPSYSTSDDRDAQALLRRPWLDSTGSNDPYVPPPKPKRVQLNGVALEAVDQDTGEVTSVSAATGSGLASAAAGTLPVSLGPGAGYQSRSLSPADIGVDLSTPTTPDSIGALSKPVTNGQTDDVLKLGANGSPVWGAGGSGVALTKGAIVDGETVWSGQPLRLRTDPVVSVVTNFQAGHGATTSAGATVTDDTTNQMMGSQCASATFTSSGSTVSYVFLPVLGATIDLTANYLEFLYRPTTNPSNLARMVAEVSSDGGTTWAQSLTNALPHAVSITRYQKAHIGRSSFNVTAAGVNFAAINRIRIGGRTNAATTPTPVLFQSIKVRKGTATRAKVAFVQNAYGLWWENHARPLAELGLPGTVCVYPETHELGSGVVGSNTYATMDQLLTAYRQLGWSFVHAGNTHLDVNTNSFLTDLTGFQASMAKGFHWADRYGVKLDGAVNGSTGITVDPLQAQDALQRGMFTCRPHSANSTTVPGMQQPIANPFQQQWGLQLFVSSTTTQMVTDATTYLDRLVTGKGAGFIFCGNPATTSASGNIGPAEITAIAQAAQARDIDVVTLDGLMAASA